MRMLKHLQFVFVFLCSPVTAEVTNSSCLLQRHKQTTGRSGSNFTSPSVVIVGICDSGTRGVEEAVINLGFKACQWALHEGSRDNILTRKLNDYINPILTMSKGVISDIQQDAPEFAEAMDTEIAGAAESLSCIFEQESGSNWDGPITWGYKNPDHIFLLPVVDAAFDYRPKFLIVARDPRDSCTAHNRGQYKRYKQHFFYKDEQHDCWQFWARVWDTVLNTYEHSQRVAVVRVEDLVMPNPDADPTSLMKLQKVASFMGITPTEENMIAELKGMHAYNETYMGHHYNMTEEDRQQLMDEISSRHDNTLLFKSMRRLGYSTSGFELTVPECQAVV